MVRQETCRGCDETCPFYIAQITQVNSTATLIDEREIPTRTPRARRSHHLSCCAAAARKVCALWSERLARVLARAAPVAPPAARGPCPSRRPARPRRRALQPAPCRPAGLSTILCRRTSRFLLQATATADAGSGTVLAALRTGVRARRPSRDFFLLAALPLCRKSGMPLPCKGWLPVLPWLTSLSLSLSL